MMSHGREALTAVLGKNPLGCGILATVRRSPARIASSTVTKLLLSIHVLAAIIAIGPVTVAASMFPAATRRALADPADPREAAVLRNLHRVCRVYAALGVLVPVFGLATASSLGVLGDAWLIISMVLTVTAAAVLIFLVLPGQATVLQDLNDSEGAPTDPGKDTPGWSAADPGQLRVAPQSTANSDEAGRRGPTVLADDHYPQSSPEAPIPAVAAARSPEGAIRVRRMAARLGMVTGTFNLLWAVVVVLMIVRPGSTTGA
jgi:uncharacterized membrane protein